MQKRATDAEKEKDDVTAANQRLTPSEREDSSEQLPEANDAVTRANQRIARPAEEGADRLRTDAATLFPPD